MTPKIWDTPADGEEDGSQEVADAGVETETGSEEESGEEDTLLGEGADDVDLEASEEAPEESEAAPEEAQDETAPVEEWTCEVPESVFGDNPYAEGLYEGDPLGDIIMEQLEEVWH